MGHTYAESNEDHRPKGTEEREHALDEEVGVDIVDSVDSIPFGYQSRFAWSNVRKENLNFFVTIA